MLIRTDFGAGGNRSVKYLGVIVDEGLSWSEQIGYVRRRSLSALAAIRKVIF